MKVTRLDLEGALLFELRRFGDDRGWFLESWEVNRYRENGIEDDFVQDNLAYSQKGVLRGLHAQEPFPQGKLVQVFCGTVFDVIVDLRAGSPTFGRWLGLELNGHEAMQLYVPPGFAHGYYVVSESALFGYKCTNFYHPEAEFSVRWDDPDIGVQWPLQGRPVLSEKDRSAQLLRELPSSRLTQYVP